MKKSETRTCGGKLISSVILPKPITTSLLPRFYALGFKANERYLKIGVLSLESDNFTINGTLGNKSISIYCKVKIEESECKKLVEILMQEISKFIN